MDFFAYYFHNNWSAKILRDECALKCDKSLITSYENDVTRTFKLVHFSQGKFSKKSNTVGTAAVE